MPIRFLCPNCDQLLSIGRRKAGSVVNCVRCKHDVTVPTPGTVSPQAEVFENIDFDDFLTAPGGPLSDAPNGAEGDEKRLRAPMGKLVAAGSAEILPKMRPPGKKKAGQAVGDHAEATLPPPEQRRIPDASGSRLEPVEPESEPETLEPLFGPDDAEPAPEPTADHVEESAESLLGPETTPVIEPEPPAPEPASDVEELDEGDLLPEPPAPAATPTPPAPEPEPLAQFASPEPPAPAPMPAAPPAPAVPSVVYVKSSNKVTVLLLVLLILVVAFAGGIGAGWYFTRSGGQPEAKPSEGAAQSDQKPAAQAPTGPRLVGKVTYVEAGTQDVKPDVGACVILLPQANVPTKKLTYEGLSIEYNFTADVGVAADEAAGVTGVKALGGAVSHVDATGAFKAGGVKPGKYWALVISKQTERPVGQAVPDDQFAKIAEYFDSVDLLVGKRKSALKEVELAEKEVFSLKHDFGASGSP